MRWWVLHVGRLHENKQEELQKRCCCLDRISNFGEFTWIYVFVLIATWHPVISCGHMLATKNTIKMTPASGARSHFCSNCKTVQMQVTIFHQRSAEHVFCSVFLQIAVSFSCISFCDFAAESCSFGMHSGGTTGRRKEKTGRGGWAGIRVWASSWQPVTTADWPQVKDCLNCGAKESTKFGRF